MSDRINSSIRQAANGLGLLIDGVCRQIDNDGAAPYLKIEALFDQLFEKLTDYDITESKPQSLANMLDEMHEMLGSEDCPGVVRQLLTSNNLLP